MWREENKLVQNDQEAWPQEYKNGSTSEKGINVTHHNNKKKEKRDMFLTEVKRFGEKEFFSK